MSYALDSYCITPELFELETSYIGVINVQWNAGSVRHDPRRTGRSRNYGIAAVRKTHREYSYGMSDPPGEMRVERVIVIFIRSVALLVPKLLYIEVLPERAAHPMRRTTSL